MCGDSKRYVNKSEEAPTAGQVLVVWDKIQEGEGAEGAEGESSGEERDGEIFDEYSNKKGF